LLPSTHEMLSHASASLALALLVLPAAAQYPGHGISKTTYSCNDPIPAWNWLYKYFPVDTPGDECDNNICTCPASGSVPSWTIQQGRVYAKQSSSVEEDEPDRRKLQQAGKGFGMHLVNVTNHLTTGGMSTAEVEAQFIKKLGTMSTFDSFMDFNALFYTSDLEGYATTFDTDGVPYYSVSWSSSSGTTYNSIIVHVPKTQLVIELTSQQTLALKNTRRPVRYVRAAERRASERALAMAVELHASSSSSSAIITPLAVNRAVSASTMAKLDDFYVSGMGTTKVTDESDSNGYAKKCYLWPGATVDVCFYQRDDSETRGDWKVGDFETMLNKVHTNIIVGYPLCGEDKWEDNHYAIDSQKADTSAIISYIEENDVPHLCTTSGWGTSLHYAFDPTGWGIQLDLGFSSAPSDCSTAFKEQQAKRKLTGVEGTYNPACDPGTCASSLR